MHYAIWVSSLANEELDGALLSGVITQRQLGKSEFECSEYLYRNFQTELHNLARFNEDLGITF